MNIIFCKTTCLFVWALTVLVGCAPAKYSDREYYQEFLPLYNQSIDTTDGEHAEKLALELITLTENWADQKSDDLSEEGYQLMLAYSNYVIICRRFGEKSIDPFYIEKAEKYGKYMFSDSKEEYGREVNLKFILDFVSALQSREPGAAKIVFEEFFDEKLDTEL